MLGRFDTRGTGGLDSLITASNWDGQNEMIPSEPLQCYKSEIITNFKGQDILFGLTGFESKTTHEE